MLVFAKKLGTFVGCLFTATLLVMGLMRWGMVEAAAPESVIISELMYNPGTGNQNDEFLELYNTTASNIDLSGWAFTAGINMVFDPGTTIAAHDYLIVSPDISRTSLTYGVVSSKAYAPSNLSNGGETVTLKDGDGVTIDELTYDDSTPWPTSPDGLGYSLELKDAESDNSVASNWGGSLATGGTPLSQNSLQGLSLAEITNVSSPNNIAASTATSIVATVTGLGISDVSLRYRVNFDAEQTLTMLDDGNHNDGAAADGTYGITIPGQTGGSLVRFRVEVENPSGTASLPSNDDSQYYRGYVVDDGTNSDLPILRWYTSDSDFSDLVTNHLSDDVFVPAVVALGDQVFDNAKVRVKGGSSVNFPKRKYKFELPAGYVIDQPGFGEHIDEFSIQVYFLNLSEFPERLTTMALERYGFPSLVQRFVRVHKNDVGPSDFYGHYLFSETYDSTWRQANGYDSGALYKEVFDKKTRTNENTDDIDELLDAVQTLTGDDLKSYLYDNLDVASIINYNAVMAVIRNDDWFTQHNQYQYRNTETTGRWEYLPWDNDNSFMPIYFDGPFTYTRNPIIDPLPSNQGGPFYQYRLIERALFEFDEFRQMYYRRVATIYDDLYGSGLTKQWYDELFASSESTLADDIAKWGQQKQDLFDFIFTPGSIIYPEELVQELSIPDTDNFFAEATPDDIHLVFDYGEDKFVEAMEDLRQQQVLPQQQTAVPDVDIVALGGISASAYLILQNNQDTAVDISGWTIPELDFSFPQGTVLPANSQARLPSDDVAYRQAYGSGAFVLGQTTQYIMPDDTYRLITQNDQEVFVYDPSIAPQQSGNAAASPAKQNSGARQKKTNSGDGLQDSDSQVVPVIDEVLEPTDSVACVLNACTDSGSLVERNDERTSSKQADERISKPVKFAGILAIIFLLSYAGFRYTRFKHK